MEHPEVWWLGKERNGFLDFARATAGEVGMTIGKLEFEA
jgi:hypothetical protein